MDPESLARWLLMYLGVDPSPEHVQNVLINNHTSWQAKQSSHYDYIRHDLLPSDFVKDDIYVRPPTLDGDQKVRSGVNMFTVYYSLWLLHHSTVSFLYVLGC